MPTTEKLPVSVRPRWDLFFADARRNTYRYGLNLSDINALANGKASISSAMDSAPVSSDKSLNPEATIIRLPAAKTRNEFLRGRKGTVMEAAQTGAPVSALFAAGASKGDVNWLARHGWIAIINPDGTKWQPPTYRPRRATS